MKIKTILLTVRILIKFSNEKAVKFGFSFTYANKNPNEKAENPFNGYFFCFH